MDIVFSHHHVPWAGGKAGVAMKKAPECRSCRILYNACRLSRVARRADDSSPIRQPHVVTDDFLSAKLRHGFFLTPAGMAAPDYFPSGRHFSVPTLDLNQ